MNLPSLFVYRKPLARRVVQKKASADNEKITPSGIVEMRSGNCKLQHRGRSFKNERHKQFISYEMELQIPHRIIIVNKYKHISVKIIAIP